jgi:hypothetical protein
MSNPHDNVVGGAFELKQHIADNGGNLQAGLRAYVGVGNEQAYADNVQYFANQLKTGQHLDDSR